MRHRAITQRLLPSQRTLIDFLAEEFAQSDKA